MNRGTIVTGVSSNHFYCLKNLLASIRRHCPNVWTRVYDLGLSESENAAVRNNCRELKKFEFSRYPAYFDIRVNGGEYAWKPVIFDETLEERSGLVLWLDAGNLILGDLEKLWTAIQERGLVTPRSLGTVRQWTHPGMLAALNVPAEDLGKPNRNGAIVGFNADCSWARQLCQEWRENALKKECIAPNGSSRENHRQDQSLLTVLYYRYQKKHPFVSTNRVREISMYNDGGPELEAKIPSETAKLEHVVVAPMLGLGNRLRAIASAKRLASMVGARCTVIWDWPGYGSLFEMDPQMEILSALPAQWARSYSIWRTKTTKEGGNPDNRRIPLAGHPGVIVHSCHAFCADNEEKSVDEFRLMPWYPHPSLKILHQIEVFRKKQLPKERIVGMHIRRTDNGSAIQMSPDELFLREGRELLEAGNRIFLATDNRRTEEKMIAALGKRIVVYPKNFSQVIRWPRVGHNLAEIMDDYIDLLLLASCDYVVGSAGSSFSSVAMALNGSDRCRALEIVPENLALPLPREPVPG
jgi:hypothetical protein